MNKKIKSFEATSESAKFEKLFDKTGIFKDAPTMKGMLLEESYTKSRLDLKCLVDRVKGIFSTKMLSMHHIPCQDHLIMVSIFVGAEFEKIIAINASYCINDVDEDRLLWCSEYGEDKEVDSSPEIPLQKAKDFFNKMESLVENRE